MENETTESEPKVQRSRTYEEEFFDFDIGVGYDDDLLRVDFCDI